MSVQLITSTMKNSQKIEKKERNGTKERGNGYNKFFTQKNNLKKTPIGD